MALKPKRMGSGEAALRGALSGALAGVAMLVAERSGFETIAKR